MVWTDIFMSYWFWGFIIATGLMGIGYRIPLVGKLLKSFGSKQTLLFIGLIGLAFASGYLDSMFGSSASIGNKALTTATTIDITAVNGACTVAESNTQTDYVLASCTDANVVETANVFEVNGTVKVCRADATEGGTILMTGSSADFRSPSDSTDTTDYNIVEQNNLGELEIYLIESATPTTTGATKEEVYLGFDQGETCVDASFILELDEEGHDTLNQYDSVYATLDIGGKPITIEVLNTD